MLRFHDLVRLSPALPRISPAVVVAGFAALRSVLPLVGCRFQGRPRDADVHYHLGVALSYQGKLEESLIHLALALEARPDANDPLHRKALNARAAVQAELARAEDANARRERAPAQ